MEKDIYYNWFEEGGAIIRPIKNGFDLYEVPQYGGNERFVGHFNTIEETKQVADKWT